MLKVNYGRIDNFGKKHVQMAVSNGLKEDIVFVPSVQIFAFEIHSGKKIDLLGAHFGAATCCVYHSCFQVFENYIFSFNYDSFGSFFFCVTSAGVDGHVLPCLSVLTSMNKVISICGVGPIFNITQIGHLLSLFPFIFPVSDRFSLLSLLVTCPKNIIFL